LTLQDYIESHRTFAEVAFIGFRIKITIASTI